MKIEYAKVDDVNGVITMVVEESDYADQVKKQLKEIGKKHAEPGFRPGHVPAALLEKKYGSYARQEAINEVVGNALFDFIKREELNVLGNPVPDEDNRITDDNKEFVLKFKVGVAPEFELKLDKDVHMPYYKITVSDEMINRQDEAMRRRFGKQVPGEEVDATALVKGVLTELAADGTVKEGGIVVENGIVSPQYFKSDDQRALFIGKKVGDTVVFNPSATCDANPAEMSSMLNIDKNDVNNHLGDFSMAISEIIVLKEAELGEEYYKEVFGDKVTDEAGYRAAVKEMIAGSLIGDQNYRFTLDAENVIREQVGELQLPDEVLKDFLIAQNETLTRENIDAEYAGIRKQLVWDLEKDKAGRQLDVKVEEADLLQTASMIARQQFAQYGMTNVPDETVANYAKQILSDEKAHAQVARQTADMKLFNAIRNAVTLDEKEVSVDEFNALFAPAGEQASAE